MISTYVHLALQAAQEQPGVFETVYNAFADAPDTVSVGDFMRLPKMG